MERGIGQLAAVGGTAREKRDRLKCSLTFEAAENRENHAEEEKKFDIRTA
jgi:hypothetical protein